MSIPAAKRQRTDAASHALSKPFRSPMKMPPASSKNKIPIVPQDSSSPVQSGNHDTTSTSQPTKLLLQSTSTPSRTRATKSLLSSSVSLTTLNADPEFAALIKTQRQLERELREKKQEVDIAEQAKTVEEVSERKAPGGAIDWELMQLILKWRAASRQAAEELFTGVRDRINRMGGPRAWKEMQEREKDFRSWWVTESLPQPDTDNDGGQDVVKRDLYAEYNIEPETANEEEERGDGEIFGDNAAGEEFTMAMMLHSLNVPLTTIGYDKENQRWVG